MPIPAQAGLVAAAQTAPFLIWFLPAGALVDRCPRKWIMLVANAGRAVALASVAVAVLLGRIVIGYLIAVAFAEGTLYVFFLLAETAAVPYVVPRPQLPAAVVQNQARDQGAGLIGQPLGGFLFGLGHAMPFAVDAVSYLVGVAMTAPIRRTLEEERSPERRHLPGGNLRGRALAVGPASPSRARSDRGVRQSRLQRPWPDHHRARQGPRRVLGFRRCSPRPLRRGRDRGRPGGSASAAPRPSERDPARRFLVVGRASGGAGAGPNRVPARRGLYDRRPDGSGLPD